ncbi:MAG: radical SAM protein, partial [Treponema sp.]|nr:radical SAM protein [Treponema sp.]
MAERLYYDKINEVRNDSRFSVSPPPLPVNDLRIELSNFCNHQCIFCAHRKMTRPKKQMDEKFLFRILQEAYDAGFRGLGYYASGEPFMSPKLADYVKRAKDIGYEYVYIDSNGAAVNFGRIKEVIDAGLDSIKFSINGTDRDTYKLIHGRDDFEKVISNMKQTWEYKHRLDRKLNVFVSFAVTRFTEDTLDSFLKGYSKYADDIITADVIDMGGYVPEVREYLRTKKQTDFMKGMSVPCYTLWNTFIITCEGYVTACCADFQNYFVYADL